MSLSNLPLLLLSLPFTSIAQPTLKEAGLFTQDTLWEESLQIGVETFIALRKAVYRLQADRDEGIADQLGAEIWGCIEELDSIYRAEITGFKNWFAWRAIGQNATAYAYLDMMIELDKLYFLPDVYAGLLNPMRARAEPRVGRAARLRAGELIEVVWQRLEASGHRGALLEEAAAFSQMTADFRARVFQGALMEEERARYRLMDYLLLLQR